MFDEAKDEILKGIDKGKEKTLLALDESTDEQIQIVESSENEHIFSGFLNGMHLFHFGSHHKDGKKKSTIQKSSQTINGGKNTATFSINNLNKDDKK